MKLPLTEEQAMIRDMIHEFARSEIEPHAQDYNERGEYPVKIIKSLGSLGLFGMMVPETYGGSGAGAWVELPARPSRRSPIPASVAVTLSVTNLRYGAPDAPWHGRADAASPVSPGLGGACGGSRAHGTRKRDPIPPPCACQP